MKILYICIFQIFFCFLYLFCNEPYRPSVGILTRTYHRDGDILIRNAITTLNLFVNRDLFKFGVILDDESEKDHALGDQILEKNYVDYVRYEPLPPNHLLLFQALAFYPNFSWGYDRQQWSTFYMDLYSDADIIGIIDSDSTFTTYLTYEDILTKDGRIRIHGVAPLASWENPLFPLGDGSQFCNDAIALGFHAPYDLMNTNRMPIFFWRSTYINLRKYIANLYGISFDEAFKIFSRNRYCQFNILANYALKFEPEKYEFVDQTAKNVNLISVAQNGCPNTRDILVGGIKSFNISKEEVPQEITIAGHAYASSYSLPMLEYEECLNDQMHANNFSIVLGNPCPIEYINQHYDNVYRDIGNLSIEKQQKLRNNFLQFLNEKFNEIIIK